MMLLDELDWGGSLTRGRNVKAFDSPVDCRSMRNKVFGVSGCH